MKKVEIILKTIYHVIEQIIVLRSLKKKGFIRGEFSKKEIISSVYKKECRDYETKQLQK